LKSSCGNYNALSYICQKESDKESEKESKKNQKNLPAGNPADRKKKGKTNDI